METIGIEIPVNGIFKVNDTEYKAIEDKNGTICLYCEFRKKCHNSHVPLLCDRRQRNDKIGVYFIKNREIDKKEEGEFCLNGIFHKSYFKDIIHFLVDSGFNVDEYYPEHQDFSKSFNDNIEIVNSIEDGYVNQTITFDLNGKYCTYERSQISIYEPDWKEKLISATKKNLRAVLDIQTNVEIEKLFNK